MKRSIMRRKISLVSASALFLTVALTACSANEQGQKEEREKITVFAAASLNAVFTEMKDDFEALHPDEVLVFSFAGSQTLVDQILAGAPADVIATANTSTMKKLLDSGDVGQARSFTTNTLVLATPKNNPGRITGIDASLTGKKLVICADVVPCGKATKKLAELLGVRLQPVSEEEQVSDVVGKIISGQADAGLIYKTDTYKKNLEVIHIPRAEEVVNNYLIAPVRRGEDGAHTQGNSVHTQGKGAQEFIDYILSESGQNLLEEYGFGKPAPETK